MTLRKVFQFCIRQVDIPSLLAGYEQVNVQSLGLQYCPQN